MEKEPSSFRINHKIEDTKIDPSLLDISLERAISREFEEFRLRQFSKKGQEEGAAMLGNDAFTEIYFQTRSGSMYKIYKNEGKFILLNAGTSQEIPLSEEDLEDGVLKVGMPFRYKKGNTTMITKITCVNTNKIDLTQSHSTNIRKEFEEKLRAQEK